MKKETKSVPYNNRTATLTRALENAGYRVPGRILFRDGYFNEAIDRCVEDNDIETLERIKRVIR